MNLGNRLSVQTLGLPPSQGPSTHGEDDLESDWVHVEGLPSTPPEGNRDCDTTRGKHLLATWVKNRRWKASHLFKQLKSVFFGLAETLSKAQPFLGT